MSVVAATQPPSPRVVKTPENVDICVRGPGAEVVPYVRQERGGTDVGIEHAYLKVCLCEGLDLFHEYHSLRLCPHACAH